MKTQTRKQTDAERRAAARVSSLYGALGRAWEADDQAAVTAINEHLQETEVELRIARMEAAQ